MKLKNLLWLFFIAAVVFSCRKETPVLKNLILNQTSSSSLVIVDEEDTYDSVLMAAQLGLLELSRNPVFRDSVHAWCQDEFDGDVNVLLKYVDEKWSTLKAEMDTSIVHHADTPSNYLPYVQAAIDGFAYDGGKAFAQIFVPFDDLVVLSDDPMICLNLNDDAVLPGHQLNQFDQLLSEDINENYATENLVWVVSMSETMLSQADYDDKDNFVPYGASVTTVSVDSSVYDTTLLIYRERQTNEAKLHKKAGEKVQITLNHLKPAVHKEKWGNGKNEVAFVARQGGNDCTDIKLTGRKIAKIKKSKINDYHPLSAPNQIAQVSGGVSPYEYKDENLFCLVYEYDRRAKWDKVFYTNAFDGINANCNFLPLHFTSKETGYGDVRFHGSWWHSHYPTMTGNPRKIDCDMNGGVSHLVFEVAK